MGVLRKIYQLYISDLKPTYEEGNIYNTENEGFFQSCQENIVNVVLVL